MRLVLSSVLGVLALAVCATALAATPAATAKATFVARADTICERSAKRIDLLLDAYGPDRKSVG